jgi:hemolysin activation/secretion protein
MPCRLSHFVNAAGWLAGLWLLLGNRGAAASPAMAQTYPVQAYAVRGNTALAEADLRGALTNATGPAVSLNRICRAVAALRQAYCAHGYPHVVVSLPEQTLTNGLVTVEVTEGDPVAGDLAVSAPTNAVAPMKFEVRHFEVEGNTLLPTAELDRILQPATGPAVTLEQIRQAAGDLRRAYRERGWITVAVSVPPQRLTNATVHLTVTEGKLASVQMVGNEHFSAENIRRALPDLKTNMLLNRHIFQRELDTANRNRDRQIYPELGPGPDPGTSALTLRVKDRLPLHAHLEADNDNTPGTPDLRVNFAAQYDNLWQRDQQAGLAYSFTPQEMKTVGNTPDFGINQPLVTSYSAFYRIPVSTAEPLADRIASSSRFGYQETTHEFLLPPAQADCEFAFYASASSSDTGVKWGSYTTIVKTNLLSIGSQDSQQSLSENENVGVQFRFPLAATDHSRLAGLVGVDFKRFSLAGYGTNNFFVSTTTTNQYGADTNQSVVSAGQPSVTAESVYFPLNLGVEYLESDAQGQSAASLVFAGNFTGSQNGFSTAAYSTNANPTYVKAVLNASRDQKLPAGCSLFVRASGQAADGALIGNEQFALGGVNSVRGYYEGDAYGDSGWNGTVELRSPYFGPRVATLSGTVPAWLRASVFTDVGQGFLLEPASTDESFWLWGAGFGLSANVNNHLEARVCVAWPLISTPYTERGTPRVNFSIGGQF